MSKNYKINCTADYSIFHQGNENRPLNMTKHKKLLESMKKYGFLKSFPIVCRRDDKGRLQVRDGQHRLTFAQSLKIPVWWIEEDVDFDIAEINTTSKVWVLRDYAERFAKLPNKHYAEAIEFSNQHAIPIGIAFAMLAGTTTFGNIQDEFTRGEFKIKDRSWAEIVVATYCPLVQISPECKGNVLLLACMAVARVEGFEPARLINGAKANPGLLKSYSIRDEFLIVLEELYNHKRIAKNRIPLKFLAVQAMASRAGFAMKWKEKPKAKE